MTHDLKIWPAHFYEVWTGEKTFEVRKNDRDYQPGDKLHLREWDPKSETYTGNEMTVAVPYVLWNAPGVERDYVVLSVKPEAATVVAPLWFSQPGFQARITGMDGPEAREQSEPLEPPAIKIVAGRDVPWRDVFAAARRELEKQIPLEPAAPSDSKG